MKIWLTGGSGSGKSYIASLFQAAGYRLIDADRIAREIAEPGGAAYAALVAAFGTDFLLPDGRLHRQKLGKTAFSDREKLRLLNDITHKYIIEEMEKQAAGEKNVVMDAPLPNTFGVFCDRTLVVTAPKECRVRRIMERDGITEEMALERLGAQVSDAEYAATADAVLHNDGDRRTAEEKAARYIKEWFSN
ncbi:MAG: dephospho-CoA kinase [Ruminococcaceae bacterium]|nr:dephospho-CoA kinase [Oscillospiraceae bacterium]